MENRGTRSLTPLSTNATCQQEITTRKGPAVPAQGHSVKTGETRERRRSPECWDNSFQATGSMLSTRPQHQFELRSCGSPKIRFSNLFSQDSLMFVGARDRSELVPAGDSRRRLETDDVFCAVASLPFGSGTLVPASLPSPHRLCSCSSFSP